MYRRQVGRLMTLIEENESSCAQPLNWTESLAQTECCEPRRPGPAAFRAQGCVLAGSQQLEQQDCCRGGRPSASSTGPALAGTGLADSLATPTVAPSAPSRRGFGGFLVIPLAPISSFPRRIQTRVLEAFANLSAAF